MFGGQGLVSLGFVLLDIVICLSEVAMAKHLFLVLSFSGQSPWPMLWPGSSALESLPSMWLISVNLRAKSIECVCLHMKAYILVPLTRQQAKPD